MAKNQSWEIQWPSSVEMETVIIQVCNDYDNGWLAVVGWPAGQKLSAWLVPDCENSNLRMIARITWGIYIYRNRVSEVHD